MARTQAATALQLPVGQRQYTAGGNDNILTNDRRAAIKRRLNDRLGSDLIEEKSFAGSTVPAGP